MIEMNITSTMQGKNSLYFSLNDQNYCYEKLTNSIHKGTKEEMMELFHTSESIKYTPKFEGESLKKQSTGNLESLLLNVTESCNLRCSYCIYGGDYEGERRHSEQKMTIETAKKAIDIFATHINTKYGMVGFYGGEPTLNMKLMEQCVEYSKEKYPEKEFVFSLTTNLYASNRVAEKIVENNMYATVSMDGPKQIHDKQRKSVKGKPTYDKIQRHIEVMENKSPGYIKSHVGINSTCQDADDFREIMKYMLENDDKFFTVRANFAESKGTNESKKKSNSIDILSEYGPIYVDALARGVEPPKVLKHFFDQPLKVFYNKSVKQMPGEIGLLGSCLPLERKMFVDTDGKFYMCEKVGRRIPLGDIDKGIDKKAIDDCIDKITEVRNSTCGSCWSNRACTSCIQTAKDTEDEISSKGLKSKCKEFQMQTLIGLALYVSIIDQDPTILEKYFDRRDKNGI